MTKITKKIKLLALNEYFNNNVSMREVYLKYGIAEKLFKMLVAGYKVHGPDILFNPPKVDGPFRVKLIKWAIENKASYTDIASKFGYIGSSQIINWKNIYRTDGVNGLLSISKGRKPKVNIKNKSKKVKETNDSPTENRLAELEKENLELRITNEALKLLASMKQKTKK